jgi:hypothetical protein
MPCAGASGGSSRHIPEGLHHAAIAQALGVESTLGPTLRGMLRDSLVKRVGLGAYAVAEEEA